MVTIEMELVDRLSDELRAKVEIDAEGSIVVTPAADPHVMAQGGLILQLGPALPPELAVVPEGPRWAPLGGEKPSYVPDVAVVHRSAMHRGPREYTLAVPPVLIVEVLSPETRRRDLTEKAEAYFAGGADAYWTVELPGLTAVDRPMLVHRRCGIAGWEASERVSGVVHFDHPFTVTIDLDRLQI